MQDKPSRSANISHEEMKNKVEVTMHHISVELGDMN